MLPVNDLLDLEDRWEDWLRRFFPRICSKPFAEHHKDFWQWVSSVQPGESIDSFISIWSRGHGKSSNAEMACVYLGAKQARNYVIYLSETQDQADKHVNDIAALLESDELAEHYPYLCQRKVGLYGHSKGWRRNRLVTATGFIVDALGLDTAARGIKFEGHRPDFIVFDDIDGKHDSVGATKKKIEILTHNILPAGAAHLTVLGAQNLIHRNSIFHQLYDGRAEFLADRIISGPYPALKNFTYKKREKGIGHDIVTGEPTWAGASVEVCQNYINKFGLKAFLAECQHDVSQLAEGALFPEWRETHHVITKSEFQRFYGIEASDYRGNFRIPLKWSLGRGQDWGTTPGHPCVTVFAARPAEGFDLNDSGFIYREIVCPTWPPIDGAEPEPVWPGKVARLIQDAQRPWNEEARMRISVMSHEASATLNTYLYELPEKLFFTKWEPDARAGIAQIQEYLAIDWDKPHPFRIHPLTGEPLMGCPRLFFIVDDGQGELYIDSQGRLAVKQAINSGGLARLRWEIPQYHNRIDASGLETNKPEDKRDDDAVDGLKGLLDKFLPRLARLSPEEREDQKLAEQLQLKNIKKLEDPEDQSLAWQARQIHIARQKRNQVNKPTNNFSWMNKRR